MKEVELKVRNIDKEKIVEKIKQLGAKKVFEGKVIDFRFDTPDRDLSRQGKALRIRQKGSHVYLNLKGKKKSQNSIIGRDEASVKISNFKVMQKMLSDLGYIKIFELIKYRTQYRLNDMNFDLDEYIGLDPILEIESDSYDKVKEYTDILEIKDEDVGRVYIREILEAKKNMSAKEFFESRENKVNKKDKNVRVNKKNRDMGIDKKEGLNREIKLDKNIENENNRVERGENDRIEKESKLSDSLDTSQAELESQSYLETEEDLENDKGLDLEIKIEDNTSLEELSKKKPKSSPSYTYNKFFKNK